MAEYVNPQFANLLKNDPRYGLAQSLLQSGLQPSDGRAGGLGVLAQALTAGLGAYQTKKLNSEYKDRQQTAAGDLASALGQMNGQDASTQSYPDGTTINWEAQQPNMQQGMRTLASNPDLADTATELQLNQLKGKQDLANQLAKMQAEASAPLSTKEKIDNQYKDREMTTDAYGNTIPKYTPTGGVMAQGALPAQSSSVTGADVAAQPLNGIPANVANSPKVLIARAEEQAKEQAKSATTSNTNMKSAQEFMAKSGDLRNLLQKKNADGSFAYDQQGNPIPNPDAEPLFGKVVGSPSGQALNNVLGATPLVGSIMGTGTEQAGLRDNIQNQLSNLELSVAGMKLKGQGQITDAERQMARNTLPQLNNASAVTALQNLGQTEAEAKRILGGNQSSKSPVTIPDKSSYDALPSGSHFVAPDGTTRIKP